MAENFYVDKENVFIDCPSTLHPAIYNVYLESGGVCRSTKQGRKDIENSKTSVVLLQIHQSDLPQGTSSKQARLHPWDVAVELVQDCAPSQTLSMMCQYVQQSLMRLAVQIILTSLPPAHVCVRPCRDDHDHLRGLTPVRQPGKRS